MKPILLLFVMTALAAAQTEDAASTNAVIKVRVTGDRVSLRAEPKLEGYLLDRAMRGDELVFIDKTNGWVAVEAPESLDFWVAEEYIENGIVQPKKLNVRAGPSLNYARVGILSKGDAVESRGEFNKWLKIVPPKTCIVWISEDYVEVIQPPLPDPAELSEPESAAEPEVEPDAVTETEVVPDPEGLPPLMLVLDKNREQGVYVELPGVLRRANPGLYKLVLIQDGFEEPICLVRGRESQMERYLNRSMLIKGKRYWAKDIDLPVVQPERIHLDPLIVD
jgi:hypothetical protein